MRITESFKFLANVITPQKQKSPSSHLPEELDRLVQNIIKQNRLGDTPVILFSGKEFKNVCRSNACPAFKMGRLLSASHLETVVVDGSQTTNEIIKDSVEQDVGLNDLMAGFAQFENIVHSDFDSGLQFILPGTEVARDFALESHASRSLQIFSALRLVYSCVIIRADLEISAYLLTQIPDMISHIVQTDEAPEITRLAFNHKAFYCEFMRLNPDNLAKEIEQQTS